MSRRFPSRRVVSPSRAGFSASAFERLDPRVLLSAATTRVGEEWIADQFVPAVRSQLASSKPLSQTSRGDARALGVNYLATRAAAAGLPASLFTTAIVTSSYADDPANGGMTHTYLRETFNGLPVLNALANVSVNALGQVIAAADNFVSLPKDKAAVAPARGIADTLATLAGDLGIALTRGVTVLSSAVAGDRSTQVSAPDLADAPFEASLAYVAAQDGTLDLVWHTTLDLPDHSHWYELGASTATGDVVFATDYVDSLDDGSSYNVYALPTISPIDGPRTVIANAADAVASPFGWLDTNGVAGADSTLSVGNNVSAQEDRDNNNVVGTRANGGAGLSFDFAFDQTTEPTVAVNQQAAITNLFYLNNTIHDITYRYGFTDAAGNFQTNNYGRGGAGNDAVQADAQDGSGTNNANFASPPDGTAGRMQMYLFTAPTPDRDGDFDATVVIHEYTHGISNRLTGGPANASALGALQSGGMGEGWGDWLALLLTSKPTDVATSRRPSGTYVLNQGNTTGAGIRRYPYTTDKAVDPLVSSTYNTSTEVHDAGEIWCSVLWDMTWGLINKLGKASSLGGNIRDGYTVGGTNGGDQLALRLVLDGMKLQPANPSFKDARDAILAADVNLTGGANQNEIWTAFAGRGFGYSFVDASSSATSVTAAFDTPPVDPLISSPATLNLATVFSSTTLNFSEAINPSSFSIVDDVRAFTGPGGVNLKPAITGFTFTDSKTLRIDFAVQNSIGSYTLAIGPNILAADDGHAVDQDHDGIVGEDPGDVFTQTINLQPFTAADLGGYKAGPASYDTSIDLTAGGAGVVTVVDNADDTSNAVALGTNTFRFYGVNYTGSTGLYASSNGLITLGASNTAYTNTDLTSSPTQPAIAVLWADLLTNVGTTDAVLARLDDTTGDSIPDRLVVEWNDVRFYDASANGVTFRAILQLNTGTNNGTIVLQYPDLDAGTAAFNNGNGTTIGIKAAGTQSATATFLPAADLVRSGERPLHRTRQGPSPRRRCRGAARRYRAVRQRHDSRSASDLYRVGGRLDHRR